MKVGGSAGIGLSASKVAYSQEKGTLENYGTKADKDFFYGIGNPSVGGPVTVTRIRGGSTENCQPVEEGRGWALSAGPWSGSLQTLDELSTGDSGDSEAERRWLRMREAGYRMQSL